MRQKAQSKIARTAEMIADHIAKARNYAAALEGICKCAATDKPILLHHAQFFATIKTALWGAMLLNVHHCLDRRKEALGFHSLFKQIRAYLPEENVPTQAMNEGLQNLLKTEEAKTVARWRSEMVAHVAYDHQSYGHFLKDVPCDFRDIDRLLMGCELLLDECRRTFPDLRIARVLSLHVHAESSVTAVMEALRMAHTASHGTALPRRP